MQRVVSISLLAAVASSLVAQSNTVPGLDGRLTVGKPQRDDEPLLYTVTQAAHRLNVSRSTVWRIIRAKRLTKIEIYPGCERLRRADIEAIAGGAS